MVCCMRACRHWGAFVSVSSSVVVSACLSTFLRVCFDQPLRWRPVTKVVDDICNNTVELYVAGFHGEIKCCTTVTQSRSRIMTLWTRNYLEDLGPEFTAGMRLFLCVLKAAKLTYRRSRELDDNLKGVHWMVIGIARLQHAGWRDCSPVYRSDVVHDLLRFAADCDFDEVAVDVGKGGISPKRSPAYKKFSNHAIVVMYDGRNLTSRCTQAKLQRIQGRLRQIVEFFERDPRQFWSQQQDIWPQIEMPEESDFAVPNTLRAVCTLTMPSGRDMFSAQPQAGPARGGPPLPKQQPAAPAQAHFPPRIQVPTAPPVRFQQPPPQAMARPQPPGWEPDPEPPRGPSAKQQPPSPASFLQPPTHGPRVYERWQQSPPPRLPKQPPPPPSHMQLPWQPEGPPPVVPVGTNLSAGPGVGNMNSRPSFVLPQGIELRHIQSSTVLGGVAMRCACQDHEFFMVVPNNYIGDHALHAIIHIAGCDGDEAVTSTGVPAEAVQELFVNFAWVFFAGAAEPAQQWREPPNFWMLDVAIRLRPSFASMALMGFARGGSWASILCRLRPQMFRCVIVLGGYPPSPGTDEQQQQEEAAAVCAAVDNVMVVMSKADCLSPPNACAKWLRVLLWNGAHIVVGETWTHDSLRTMFVHGHVQDTLAQETLEEIHALLLDA